MKIFKKNTIKCDRCEKPIEEKDKAYCFHGNNSNELIREVYICAPCVVEVYKDFVENEKNA